MKTKIAYIGRSFCLLSLLSLTGIVFALPAVESHSGSGWVSSEPSREQNQSATLELLRKVEYLQQEVQELRGKVEEQAYLLSQLKDSQTKLYLDLDKRLQTGSNQPASRTSSGISLDSIEMSIPEQESQTSHPDLSSQPVSSADLIAEEKTYQQAYHLVQNKDYEGAKQAFLSLITHFPKGKYTPNAHYWLGEIYMAKGDLKLAFNAFDSVYQHYPQHPKAADSLLKLGYVEYAKGEWKRSKELLTQVKQQFPGSTSAQLADAKLQRMQKEGHL